LINVLICIRVYHKNKQKSNRVTFKVTLLRNIAVKVYRIYTILAWFSQK
jgi:hypothetical protein